MRAQLGRVTRQPSTAPHAPRHARPRRWQSAGLFAWLTCPTTFDAGHHALDRARVCGHIALRQALVKAHQKLDTAVDAAYQPSCGKKTYATDADRVAFLFDLYQRITSLLPVAKPSKAKRQPKAVA